MNKRSTIASMTRILFMLVVLVFFASPVFSLTLWSSVESFNGTGTFHGPGNYKNEQPLFETVLRNLLVQNEQEMIVPYHNNDGSRPNICAEEEVGKNIDGRLSNGVLINENVDTCLASIAGTDMVVAVPRDGQLNGHQHIYVSPTGDVVVTMDLALDLGIGEKGIVRIPFYGTTGQVTVPYSLQTQNQETGVDRAGIHPSGTVLKGRIGDYNQDGWLDGTLVSVGTMPLDSPVYPGQPFAMVRHFELSIPVSGSVFGNVKALHTTRELTAVK